MSGANHNITDNRAANEDGSVSAGAGGGGGVERSVVVANVAANQTITATSLSALPTDLKVDFTTTKDNEYVTVNFIGTVSENANNSDLLLGLQLDSDTAIEVAAAFNGDSANNSDMPIPFSQEVLVPTAGAHSIRIMAAKSSGTGPLIYGESASFRNLELQVVVYAPPANATVPTTALPSPSGSFTNATYTGFYSITNGIMSIEYLVNLTGTPGAANLTVDLPAGYNIDTSKLITNPEGINWLNGQGYAVDTSVNNYAHMFLAVDSATAIKMYYGDGDTLIGQVTNVAPFSFGNTDYVWLDVKFPVVAI